jgi:hypothetical protein
MQVIFCHEKAAVEGSLGEREKGEKDEKVKR